MDLSTSEPTAPPAVAVVIHLFRAHTLQARLLLSPSSVTLVRLTSLRFPIWMPWSETLCAVCPPPRPPVSADDPGEEAVSLQGCYSITNPQSETSLDRETRCNVTAETLSDRTRRCTERQYLQAPRCFLQPEEASYDIPSMTSLITAAQGAQKLPSPSLGNSRRPDDSFCYDRFLPSQISHQSNPGHLSCSWGFGGAHGKADVSLASDLCIHSVILLSSCLHSTCD